MALLPRQIMVPASSASGIPTTQSMQVYLVAVLLAVCSLIIMLLVIPPMLWHFRNRNIGATALVGWVVMLLFFTFVNSILWPNDDTSSWYKGVGLCDVEVKIQVASQVAFPASMACILRALAAVMDTDTVTLVQTQAQRRRRYMIDISWCVGFPMLQMLLHYIVQTRRYYLYGISGCVPAVSRSLVTIFLLVVPPMTWTLIDSYYSVLILVRLYRYRLTFNSILACSNTTKSRFMRLYVICMLWIMAFIPIQAYSLYINVKVLAKDPYSWSMTHDPKYWREIIMTPSGGKVLYDRWIWLTCGVVVFVFFGLGKDALSMYRTGLLAIGLSKVIPSLRPDHRSSTNATLSSFSSKAKMLFKGKSTDSDSMWTSTASNSHASTQTEPTSPKLVASPIDTVNEYSSIDEKETDHSNARPLVSQTQQKPVSTMIIRSFTSRLFNIFRARRRSSLPSRNPLPLTALSGQPTTVRSIITSGPISPALSQHIKDISSDEMLVRMEIRQGDADQRS